METEGSLTYSGGRQWNWFWATWFRSTYNQFPQDPY